MVEIMIREEHDSSELVYEMCLRKRTKRIR